jgi:hypothetical protein
LSNFSVRYTTLFRFDEISTELNVTMKKINTVVEAWPTKQTLQLGHKEAEHEFKVLLGSNYTCLERFAEWKHTK